MPKHDYLSLQGEGELAYGKGRGTRVNWRSRQDGPEGIDDLNSRRRGGDVVDDDSLTRRGVEVAEGTVEDMTGVRELSLQEEYEWSGHVLFEGSATVDQIVVDEDLEVVRPVCDDGAFSRERLVGGWVGVEDGRFCGLGRVSSRLCDLPLCLGG